MASYGQSHGESLGIAALNSSGSKMLLASPTIITTLKKNGQTIWRSWFHVILGPNPTIGFAATTGEKSWLHTMRMHQRW